MLSKGIKEAKRLYAQKLDSHFRCNKDPRRLWQGLQHIMDYTPLPPTSRLKDCSRPDQLNNFYARFEANITTQAQVLPLSSGDQLFQLSTAEVRKAFASINPS